MAKEKPELTVTARASLFRRHHDGLVTSDLSVVPFLLIYFISVKSRTPRTDPSTDQCTSSSTDQSAKNRTSASSQGHIDPIPVTPVITWLPHADVSDSSVSVANALDIGLGLNSLRRGIKEDPKEHRQHH